MSLALGHFSVVTVMFILFFLLKQCVHVVEFIFCLQISSINFIENNWAFKRSTVNEKIVCFMLLTTTIKHTFITKNIEIHYHIDQFCRYLTG